MGADPLAEFYSATPRQPAGLSGRAGLEGQVDAIVEELGLPAELVDGGNLRLGSDVGDFLLIVDDETSDLVALQSLQSLDSVEGAAEEMYGLLRLNYEARGVASFGALKDQGEDFLVLTARVGADAVSRGSVETMLADCFALSRRVQELLGEAPAGATEPGVPAEPPPAEPLHVAAEPEPTPPAEPEPAAAPAAETVFAQPVPSGPPPAAGPAAPEPAAATVFEPTPAPVEPAPPAEPAAPAGQPAAELDFPPPQVDDPPLAFPPPGQAAPAQPAAAEQPPVVQQPPAVQPPAAQPAPSYPPPAQPTPPPQQMAPANWYPDPYSQARLRYWDGQNWTEHVAQ